MKTQLGDSQTPIFAEAGISWKLIANNETLADKSIGVYKNLKITAVGAGIVTLDGVDSVYLTAGETMIINTGLGDPRDSKRVKVTTSMAVYVSEGIDASRARQQDPVE